LIWGSYDDAVRKFMTWERFGTKFDPPIPATLKPLILITIALLALQAISNLIFDWNTDQGEIPLVEDLDDLLEHVGADHLEARPTGEVVDHDPALGENKT
jgi:TRAP-type mannitol/chloroaromatic compound transport system permease small subunit